MFFVWYDDNPKKAIIHKINEAVLRYKQKYGKIPDTCFINPQTEMPKVEGLEVQSLKNVPVNFFWIGIKE